MNRVIFKVIRYIIAVALIFLAVCLILDKALTVSSYSIMGFSNLLEGAKAELYTAYIPACIGLIVVSTGLIINKIDIISFGSLLTVIGISNALYRNISFETIFIFATIPLILYMKPILNEGSNKYMFLARKIAGILYGIIIGFQSRCLQTFTYYNYQSINVNNKISNYIIGIILTLLIVILVFTNNSKKTLTVALCIIPFFNAFSDIIILGGFEVISEIFIVIPVLCLMFVLYGNNTDFYKKINKHVLWIVPSVIYCYGIIRNNQVIFDIINYSAGFVLLSIWCAFSVSKNETKAILVNHKQISENMELPGPEIPVVETRNSRKKVESKSTSVNTPISIPDEKILSLNPGDSPVQMSFTFQCINVIQTHGFTVYGRPQRLKDKMSFVIDADYNNEHYEFYCIFKGNNNEPEICLLDRKYPTFARI